MSEPTTSGSVLRGGFWSTAARIIPQLYALAISIVAARYLGPEGMGRQSFIAFVELSVAALLSQGFFLALMRFVGETLGRGEPASLRGLLVWAWRVQGVAAVAGGGFIVTAALLGQEPRSAWLLAAVVATFATLHAVPSAVLIGVQRWRDASIVGLTTGLLGTAASVVVLDLGGGITGMFAVEAVVSVVNLVWTGALARRVLGRVAVGRGSVTDLRGHVIRAAGILSLAELLALVVQRRSEVFFLERYSTDAEIALYSIVFSVVTALVQVPTAMAAAVSPAVATLFGAGAVERIRAGYERALRLLVVSTLPLTAAGLSVGPSLLRLVYGNEYRGTGPVLLIMMAIFPVIAVGGLAAALLTGIGRLRLLLAASAVAASTNVTLALVLIPRHHAVGAALANGAGQIALVALLLGSVHWLAGGVRLEARALSRAALAALLTGLVGRAAVELLGDTASVVVGGLLGLLVFGVLAIALRILPRDDAAWLEEALGGHLRGWLGRFFRACSRRTTEHRA